MSAAAPWWRDAVFYQVYVRSFADSDGDGFGDLPGITSRLDHLAGLGVDAVWITPFYPSPQLDHGYDVADYRDVDPTYGTLADFDALVSRAAELGLRIVVDLVPNHTSWEHRWFTEALGAEPGSPARERYLFRDGRGPDGSEPPNNWLSLFGGGAWERVPDGQWYLHLFDKSQPDLNWRNPEVGEEFETTLRFWLERGVSGFRVDVAHALFKAEGLPDVADPLTGIDGVSLDQPMWDQPEVHDVYRRWHLVLEEYDDRAPGERMAVGEAWVPTAESLARFVRPDELQQSFNFHWLLADWSATAFRAVIEETLATFAPVGASSTWVLSNHDVVRTPTRYGGGAQGVARATAAMVAMLALPGSAYIYQGEELGLEQVEVPEALRQDPEFRNGRGVGRDGCRVPIPWGGDQAPYDFGPGDAQPWLPQPDDWAALSVTAQRELPDSTLSCFTRALAARREIDHDVREIDFLDLDPGVLAFRRGELTVLLNCTDAPVPLPEASRVVLASGPVSDTLPPDTAVWLR